MNQTIATALTIAEPIVELFVTVIVPILATMVAAQVIGWLNLKNADQKAAVEEQLRFALHKSAENALNFAMAKYGFIPGTQNLSESLSHTSQRAARGEAASITKMEDVIDAAVNDYLKKKMPDTIKKLKATPEDLADIVMSKVAKT